MIYCAKCEAPTLLVPVGQGATEVCRTCQREATAYVFPAALGQDSVSQRSKFELGSEALCFHCPTQSAVAVCESCGCYLCHGCQAEWFGKILCLGCIHSQREVKSGDEFRTKSIIPDNIALALILFPLAFIYIGWFFLFLTAPMALYFVIRYWKKPHGLVPRGRFRLISAGIMALAFLGLVFVGISLGIWKLMALDESLNLRAKPTVNSPESNF